MARGHSEGVSLLVVVLGATLAAAPARQREPHKMMGDELYAAYLVHGPSILAKAFTNGTRVPEFVKDFGEDVLPRWEREPRQPMRAMFMTDIAASRRFSLWPGFLYLAQSYLTSRPEPLGANPAMDAFELQWHKTAFASVAGLTQPYVLQQLLLPMVGSGRVGAGPANPDRPSLIDPWVALATGFVHETHAFARTEGSGRAETAIDSYKSATASEATRAEATTRLARVWLFLGKPGEALQTLDTFQDAWTRDTAIVYWSRVLRGKALAALDRPAEARRAYESALEIQPEAPSPRIAIMAIDAKRGRAEAAESRAADIRTASSDVSDYWWQLPLGDARFHAEWDRRLREMAKR
jgi:hypothetical protein